MKKITNVFVATLGLLVLANPVNLIAVSNQEATAKIAKLESMIDEKVQDEGIKAIATLYSFVSQLDEGFSPTNALEEGMKIIEPANVEILRRADGKKPTKKKITDPDEEEIKAGLRGQLEVLIDVVKQNGSIDAIKDAIKSKSDFSKKTKLKIKDASKFEKQAKKTLESELFPIIEEVYQEYLLDRLYEVSKKFLESDEGVESESQEANKIEKEPKKESSSTKVNYGSFDDDATALASVISSFNDYISELSRYRRGGGHHGELLPVSQQKASTKASRIVKTLTAHLQCLINGETPGRTVTLARVIDRLNTADSATLQEDFTRVAIISLRNLLNDHLNELPEFSREGARELLEKLNTFIKSHYKNDPLLKSDSKNGNSTANKGKKNSSSNKKTKKTTNSKKKKNNSTSKK